jgi:hypothetical protein
MKPANIEIRIEELTLDGFAPGDGPRLGEAVERELARLFAEEGVPPSLARSGDLARLEGGPVVAAPTMDPEAAGVAVARAVHEGLVR